MIIKKFPYMAHFYVIEKNLSVEVLAVISTDRNPKVWEEKPAKDNSNVLIVTLIENYLSSCRYASKACGPQKWSTYISAVTTTSPCNKGTMPI